MSREIKFTQKLKDKWLNALRNGRYTQGTEELKRENKHCCLGVLAELHPKLSIERDGLLGYKDTLSNSDDGYGILSTWFGFDKVGELWNTNDDECDGKYTAVIPIIEKLEVQPTLNKPTQD